MAQQRKPSEPPPRVDPNMALMISLFIIIFAFFIMLNAIAVPDDKRKRIAIGSLNESFGILSGGSSLIEGNDQASYSMISTDGSRISDLNEMLKEKDGIARSLVLTGNKQRSVLTIPELRLFKPESAELIPDSYPMLDKISDVIKKFNYPVDIMGFIDDADSESRQGMSPRILSTLRAMNLQSYLIQAGKVPPTLLTAIGWGQFRPIAAYNTRETRSLNRRMEINFIHETKYEEPEGGFTFREFFFNVFEKKKAR